MATFTIDLLTGNLFLFSGDFTSSGSTPTTGSTYPQVNLYSDLPTPASAYSGQIYVVRTSSGSYVLNRKEAGMYLSVSNTWRRLGDIPSFFKSDNFQVYDSVDTSKGMMFITSGVTAGQFRKLKVQNSDGTIAYLTDLNTKLDKTTFSDYTGTTAPNTYYNKSQINSYTGSTLLLIQGKQDTLVAGQGISILGNVISVTGNTSGVSNTALQLLDTSGNTDVNLITAPSIVWTSQAFSGTSLSFTGGSRIYVRVNGTYGISYLLNVYNDSNSGKNIGTIIRKNGTTDITPLSSASIGLNFVNDSSTNVMPENLVTLVNGDYLELKAFRIGNSGSVFTVPNGSWIKIQKKII